MVGGLITVYLMISDRRVNYHKIILSDLTDPVINILLLWDDDNDDDHEGHKRV